MADVGQIYNYPGAPVYNNYNVQYPAAPYNYAGGMYPPVHPLRRDDGPNILEVGGRFLKGAIWNNTVGVLFDPKSLAIAAATTAAIVLTGGLASPLVVPLAVAGLAMGGVQTVTKGAELANRVSSGASREEILDSVEAFGEGVGMVGFSVAGARGAVKTTGGPRITANPLKIKEIPSFIRQTGETALKPLGPDGYLIEAKNIAGSNIRNFAGRPASTTNRVALAEVAGPEGPTTTPSTVTPKNASHFDGEITAVEGRLTAIDSEIVKNVDTGEIIGGSRKDKVKTLSDQVKDLESDVQVLKESGRDADAVTAQEALTKRRQELKKAERELTDASQQYDLLTAQKKHLEAAQKLADARQNRMDAYNEYKAAIGTPDEGAKLTALEGARKAYSDARQTFQESGAKLSGADGSITREQALRQGQQWVMDQWGNITKIKPADVGNALKAAPGKAWDAGVYTWKHPGEVAAKTGTVALAGYTARQLTGETTVIPRFYPEAVYAQNGGVNPFAATNYGIYDPGVPGLGYPPGTDFRLMQQINAPIYVGGGQAAG